MEGVKISEIKERERFDATPFVSEYASLVRCINRLPSNKVGAISLIHKVRNRDSRVYVKDANRGLMYLSNTDMQKTSYESAPYMSKKFLSNIEEQKLKKGDIIISAVGTIGQVALVNELLEDAVISGNILRFTPKNNTGFIYAYMQSKFGQANLINIASGSVQDFITPPKLAEFKIPDIPDPKQNEIHNLIIEASNLRVEANDLIKEARSHLKIAAKLPDLTTTNYECFGNRNQERNVSVFTRSIKEIKAITINAFNYSIRVEAIENLIKERNYLPLYECLYENSFFSTGSFRRLELNSPNSIRLLNQSDIFNFRKQGKLLAKLFVKSNRLVEYGEVLIAGVGTLGEGETFCRAIFANEELEGQLISGEFIRMKTTSKVPSGYLYAWLSSDYGFRLIRKTQSGTKLCRPIQELLKNIPVPIIDKDEMLKIDEQVKKAHTMLFKALNIENKAIELVENEIESWQKS